MKNFKYSLLILVLTIVAVGLFAADSGPTTRQVMPARRRAQILATAKALFNPEVKKSIKIGRVENPFSVAR